MTAIDYSPQKAKKEFKSELAALGIDAAAAKRVFPDWGEEAFQHPSGVFELKGYIAKHFGLRFGPGGKLEPRPLPQACFKNRQKIGPDDVASSRAIVTAVGAIVADATVPEWAGVVPAALDLRQDVLQSGRPLVGFPDVLNVCWALGIPVIYLPELPVKGKKMEGMVTFLEGRPVIIITKKCWHPAWALFILAHELGHIACGHLPLMEGSSVVDETVTEASVDEQEKAANSFALQLLTGHEQGMVFKNPVFRTAAQLATAADKAGLAHQVQPGHLILSWAMRQRQDKWAQANQALKMFPAKSVSAYCQEALRRNVDVEELSRDSAEFLHGIGLLPA